LDKRFRAGRFGTVFVFANAERHQTGEKAEFSGHQIINFLKSPMIENRFQNRLFFLGGIKPVIFLIYCVNLALRLELDLLSQE